VNVLVDTNILARSADIGHPMYRDATDATAALRMQGHVLCVVPQNFYEFWVMLTRPRAANGMGKSAPEAVAELAKVTSIFTFVPDNSKIYPEWEQLVTTHAVLGKKAHDARLVAAMRVHGVTHLLTFNAPDFVRFTGITVLTPAAVLAPTNPVAPPPPPVP
jgi:predicted nucleic acid-binding protein